MSDDGPKPKTECKPAIAVTVPSTGHVFTYTKGLGRVPLDNPHEFRREFLGEWVPMHVPHYTHNIHIADSANYARSSGLPWRNRVGWFADTPQPPPDKSSDRFMLISPALAGELDPTAVVMFDRDLEGLVAEPIFVARWGHLYVASLRDVDDCWCWNGEKWDNLAGGVWVQPYRRQWRECIERARELGPKAP